MIPVETREKPVKVWIMCYMLGRRVQSVNNGSPVTVMVEGGLFKSWYRYIKKLRFVL